MRAYTYIDRAKAHVGNRWVDRCWSAFLGATSSLVDRAARFDWLAGRSAEFGIQINGLSFGVFDFGDIEWSEENSPYGATLMARQRRPGFEIIIRTLALHDHPGLMRRVLVTNSEKHPLVVGPIRLDQLPLRDSDTMLEERRFPGVSDTVDWEPGAWAMTARHQSCTLTCLGAAGCHPNGETATSWTLETKKSVELPSGKTLSLPPTFIYLHDGAFSIPAQSACAEFLQLCAEAETPPQDDDDPIKLE